MKTNDYPALRWEAASDASIQTRLLIEARCAIGKEEADLIADAVDVFCQAAHLGAFSEGSSRAHEPACKLMSSNCMDASMQFDLACRAIDHRAFQVLRNMLGRLSDDGIRLRQLIVQTAQLRLPDQPVAPLIDEDNEDESYPPLHRDAYLAFSESDDESVAAGSWLRRCILVVREPVDQAHIDAVSEVVQTWFDVLEYGGYAMPLDFPWHVHSLGDSVNQFEACSIEIAVLRFQASEQAWVALANMTAPVVARLGLSPVSLVVDE